MLDSCHLKIYNSLNFNKICLGMRNILFLLTHTSPKPFKGIGQHQK